MMQVDGKMRLIVVQNGHSTRYGITKKGVVQMQGLAKRINEDIQNLQRGSVSILSADTDRAVQSGAVVADVLGIELSAHKGAFEALDEQAGLLISSALSSPITEYLVIVGHRRFVKEAARLYIGERITPTAGKGFATDLTKTNIQRQPMRIV